MCPHSWEAANTEVERARITRTCVAVCCSVLQCVAVCCSVLLCCLQWSDVDFRFSVRISFVASRIRRWNFKMDFKFSKWGSSSGTNCSLANVSTAQSKSVYFCVCINMWGVWWTPHTKMNSSHKKELFTQKNLLTHIYINSSHIRTLELHCRQWSAREVHAHVL